MPFFIVDDAFHDSKEIMSIPARYRHEAIGLWVRCGAWSAQKMTDGAVPVQVVMDYVYSRKHWRSWVRHLVNATLWEWSEGDDEIRFRNWDRWQQTKVQVIARKGADAARKRRSRASQQTNGHASDGVRRNSHGTQTELTREAHGKHTVGDTSPTSENAEMSRRDSRARAPRQYQRDKSLVTTSGIATVGISEPDRAADAESATPGADLVRAIIPSEHPAAVKTALRIRASELIHAGTPADDVAAALRLWLTKPHLGPNTLASLVSEVVRSRAAPTGANGQPHKMRALAELAQQVRAEELSTSRKEIE